MIVAMVGTGPDSFDRLIRPLDVLVGKHCWDAFIQLGHTYYEPKNCQFKRFVERNTLLHMIESAELVITQGGYGGIRDALLFDKPIVAVPRYPSLHEAPDHQDELVHAMEQESYLIGVYDIDNLEAAIAAARGFMPAPRQASRIPEMLNDYLAASQGNS